MDSFDFWKVVSEVVVGFQLPTILILVILDWGCGLLSGMRKKEFDLTVMADFYLTNIIPYIGGYILFATALKFLPMTSISDYMIANLSIASIIESIGTTLGFGTIVLAVGTSIFRNLIEIYSGSPLWRYTEEEEAEMFGTSKDCDN